MEQDTIEVKLRNFIYDNFPLAKRRRIDGGDSLLESGIVDSIGILDIVRFVEQSFAVQVSDDDLLPENFGSIAAIANFVQQKLKPASAQERESAMSDPR